MAHSVTGASLDGIYTRLNGAPQYHPLDAQTFADWTVEAGDVVRFRRESTDYDSPVHSAKLVWRGTPQVTVSSTGAKEREPVSRVSRRKYGRGGNAVRSEERIYREFTSEDGLLHSAIDISAAGLTTAFQNADLGLESLISVTAQNLTIDYQTADGVMRSAIQQNAQSISAEVTNRKNENIELKGSLEILANQASLVVSATDTRPVKSYLRAEYFPEVGSTAYLYYDLTGHQHYEWNGNTYVKTTPGNTINRAGIIATINDDGTSTTKILGDKVLIGGAGTSVSLSDVMAITNNVAHIKKNAYFDQEVTIANTPNAGLNLYTLNFVGSNTYTLDPPVVEKMFTDASVSGNTLTFSNFGGNNTTITKSDDGKTLTFTDRNGNNFSFEKAASVTGLTGNWSGGVLGVNTVPSVTGVSDYTVGFGGSYGSHKTELHVTTNGSPSRLDDTGITYIAAPIKVSYLSAPNGTPVSVYTDTLTYIPTQILQARTGNNRIRANGSFTPGANFIGFSEVEVDVQGGVEPQKPYGTAIDSHTVKTTGDITSNGLNAIFAITPGTFRPSGASSDAGCVTLSLDSTNIGRVIVPLQTREGANKITSNGTYTPTGSNLGFSKVVVDVTPNLENKGLVYATDSTLPITPNQGYDGISSLSIGAVSTSCVDGTAIYSAIPPNVIKSGVTIKVGDTGNAGRHVNVTGTYGAGNSTYEWIYATNQAVMWAPDPPYDTYSHVFVYPVLCYNLTSDVIKDGVNIRVACGDSIIKDITGSYVPTQADALENGWNAARAIINNSLPTYGDESGLVPGTAWNLKIPKFGYNSGSVNASVTTSDVVWHTYGEERFPAVIVKINGINCYVKNIQSTIDAVQTTYRNSGWNSAKTEIEKSLPNENTPSIVPGVPWNLYIPNTGYDSGHYNATVTISDPTTYTYNNQTFPAVIAKINGRNVYVKSIKSTIDAYYWMGWDAGWNRYYDLWQANYVAPGNGKYTYIAKSPIDHNDDDYNVVWSNVVPGSGSHTAPWANVLSDNRESKTVQMTADGKSSNFTLAKATVAYQGAKIPCVELRDASSRAVARIYL